MKTEQFKQYRRVQIAELRPFIEGEKLPEFISISIADRANGSPKVGDMIARNPNNHADQWLVSEQYFKDNFEPIIKHPILKEDPKKRYGGRY